jgi:hypothetical protein
MIDVPTGLLELPLTALIKLATRFVLGTKYNEHFVVSLSTAAVTGASSRTKNAAVWNLERCFPQHINLILYERRVPNSRLQLLSRPCAF